MKHTSVQFGGGGGEYLRERLIVPILGSSPLQKGIADQTHLWKDFFGCFVMYVGKGGGVKSKILHFFHSRKK